MVHTTTTENLMNKSTMSAQTTRHQSLKRFHNQLKKSLYSVLIIESYIYDKKCLKNSEYKNLSGNINNRKKIIKTKI